MSVQLSIVVACALAATPAFARAGTERQWHAAHHAAEAKVTGVAFSEGEVRRVDKEAGKITLKHGPIANLEMPAMSMVFRAKEPGMLEQVKPGDKIRFKAEKIQGAFTITEIQPAK